MTARSLRAFFKPRSLRWQLNLSMVAPALLSVLGGLLAVYSLHVSSESGRRLAEVQLHEVVQGRDLLEVALLIEREANRIVSTNSSTALAEHYGNILGKLDQMEGLVLHIGENAAAAGSILALNRASQVIRNSSTTITNLKANQIQGSLPDGERASQRNMLSAYTQILQTETTGVVDASRTISDNLNHAYEASIERLAEQTHQVQIQTLVLLSSSIAMVLFLSAYFLNGRVMARLQQVSDALRQGRRYDFSERLPVDGTDEIAGMARAVARFLDAHQQLGMARIELQRKEELLRGIIEAAPTAIIGIDLDGNVQSVWNKAAERMLGWSAEEVMGRHLPTVNPSDETEFAEFRARIRKGMTLDGVEVRRCRRDGSYIDYTIYASPLRDPQGNIVGNIAVLTDATERKRLEAEQRRRQEYQRVLLDNFPFVVWLKDRDGRLLTANHEYAEMVGVDLTAELEGKSDFDFFPMAVAEERMAADREVMASRTPRQVEQEDIDARGARRWMETWRSPIIVDGAVEGTVGYSRDVTQHNIDQRRIERLAAEQKAILDTDLVGIMTVKGRAVVWANPAAERTLGYQSGGLAGITPRAFYATGAGYRSFVSAARPAFRSGTTYRTQAKCRRADGAVVWLDVSGALLNPETGESVWAFIDVTEQRLSERRAKEAKEAAEAGAKAKSEFLANMSHEIRTPINAVLGLAHLLGRTEQTDQQADYTIKIEAAGRSLLNILNDILDISKIEAHRMEIEHIDFLPATVFDELATILSVGTLTKDIEVAIETDPALPRWLKGDPSRLQQVLVNLAGNAVKFTEKGTVSVRADLVEGEPPTIRFEVKDTGIGMSAEQLEGLFRPFTQADTSTTRRFGGTGLGLTICKRLVELMGGEIGAESRIGDGSTFWFTLPLEEGQAPAGSDASPRVSDLSVLVVDDNETARAALASAVRGLGWNGIVVGSGREAIERVRRPSSFDVMLIDWQMPDLDGLATSRLIRDEQPSGAASIVILVTAHDRDAVLRSMNGEAIDAVLTKPVTTSSLYNAVMEAESRRRGHNRAAVTRQGSQRLAGIRVLLVEDNDLNQQVAEEVLEGEGATVEIADNGAEAVERLRAGSRDFDVVLMDAQMPVMDGFVATRTIRSDLGLADLPVIALSAGALLSERDRCLRAGMNDFLAKPLDMNELVETILRYVNAAPASTSTGAPPSSETPSLASIPGLELQQTLKRLGIKEPVLCRLLRKLADGNADLVSDVRTMLARGRADRAAARLHRFRGGAGNLGLVRLADRSARAERAVACGQIDTAAKQLDELEIELTVFLSVVETAMPADTPGTASTP